MLLEGRKRVGRDPTLGIKHFELTMACRLEEAHIVGDTDLDHIGDSIASRRRRHADRAAEWAAEESLAAGVRRMHRYLVTHAGERAAQFEGMNDAAARDGRMCENGDPQPTGFAHSMASSGAQPISGEAVKSQMPSRRCWRTMATSRPVLIVPITAAARLRSAKRANTLAACAGFAVNR